MNAPEAKTEWSKFLKFFTEQNIGRPTRLGVFERNGDNVADYWLQSGGALLGVDLDASKERFSIQIIVGEMEHVVVEPQQLRIILSRSGEEDGLDITEANGSTTILRFELAATE